MSNEDFVVGANLPGLQKLRELYEKGVIPSTQFLGRVGEIGQRSAERRNLLKKLIKPVPKLDFEVRFGDYLQSLATAAGLKKSEAIFAVGCETLPESELDVPSESILNAATLIGLPTKIIKSMMRAGCLEHLELVLATRGDGTSPSFPHEEIDAAVDDARRSGSEAVKRKLAICEERLAHFFAGHSS